MADHDLELYLHIPFCMQKCAYCDFLSFVSGNELQRQYADALIQEIRASEPGKRMVSSVYIGGGTPSVLDPQWLKDILEVVMQNFSVAEDAEISMECNPGTVTQAKFEIYRQMGINRISFGLQSAHDEELRRLGRIHTWREFLESYRLARKAGIDNVNVDVMSGLPGQTADGYLDTLKKVVGLDPEHISAYSLILEEGTPFYQKYYNTPLEKELPNEDAEREMYWKGRKFLEGQGYPCYEISNYSKRGRECRHNIGYWTGKEYLGLGLGAASLLYGKRFHNTDNMKQYLSLAKMPEQIRVEEETVTKRRAMEEFVFLGLRMSEGIDTAEFERRFGCAFDRIYRHVYPRLLDIGVLEEREGRLFLTKKGIDVSNPVLAEFLLDGE